MLNRNAISTQNIQVLSVGKRQNGIIIKYCSLNYINTKPRCWELPKMQKQNPKQTRVNI